MNREMEERRRRILASREVPVEFNFTLSKDIHHRFTLVERVKIFLGYAVTIRIRIMMRHNPGPTRDFIEVKTTEETNPNQQ
jgi:hypothetical protein